MRQLDLFGSLFDTSTEEEKKQEVYPATQKKQEQAAIAPNDETDYSIVELAEVTLRENIENVSAVEIIEDKQETSIIEDKAEALFIAEPSIANVEEPALEETMKTEEDLGVDDVEPEKKTPISTFDEPKGGDVIFDNGKITVKVKRKPLTEPPPPLPDEKPVFTEEVIKEKSKKEPQKRGRKSLQEIEAEVDLIEVPEDEILYQKQYYSISEVAQWFRVNTSLVRYWENEFDIVKPRKNRKGDRLFRPEDVKNLQLIYQLLRQRKYTIEGAKEYIKVNRKKADLELQLTNTLHKFKSFLLDLKANL